MDPLAKALSSAGAATSLANFLNSERDKEFKAAEAARSRQFEMMMAEMKFEQAKELKSIDFGMEMTKLDRVFEMDMVKLDKAFSNDMAKMDKAFENDLTRMDKSLDQEKEITSLKNSLGMDRDSFQSGLAMREAKYGNELAKDRSNFNEGLARGRSLFEMSEIDPETRRRNKEDNYDKLVDASKFEREMFDYKKDNASPSNYGEVLALQLRQARQAGDVDKVRAIVEAMKKMASRDKDGNTLARSFQEKIQDEEDKTSYRYKGVTNDGRLIDLSAGGQGVTASKPVVTNPAQARRMYSQQAQQPQQVQQAQPVQGPTPEQIRARLEYEEELRRRQMKPTPDMSFWGGPVGSFGN